MGSVSAIPSLAVVVLISAVVAADDVQFNRDVKPILSQNCYQCHGPDDAHRAAGLRLDVRDSAIQPAESGATAIVPAKPELSELLVRISSADPDIRMPPADTGKVLTAQQVDILRRWITAGASYEGHWAFEHLVRPGVPELSGDDALKFGNPIDQFVAARLGQEGLHLLPEADRHTLIRRVALDLTGLPPSPAEVDAFTKDSSPGAYERIVDHYLKSPHYGEQMAVSWLDHARYADSNGFQSDGSRDIWAWRDWVIHAFNANLPFDQFTVEQLAGDLLPHPTTDQIIATGFNRNHRLNGEGGRIEAEWFVETVIDRVETTGLTWLGLTFNCCRCHDHKYDPITQREFYQLFAFFNSVEESGVLSPQGKNSENTPPLLTISTPESDGRRNELRAAVDKAEAEKLAAQKELPELLNAWERHVSQRKERSVWLPAEPVRVSSVGGADMQLQDDGSWLATGPNPPNDEYRIEIPLHVARLSGILLEVFPDGRLPAGSLGRGFNGNFVLTGVSAELRAGSGALQSVALEKVAADYNQPNYSADRIQLQVLPEKNRSRAAGGWAIDGNDPAKMVPRRVFFAPQKPVAVPEDAVLLIRLTHDSQFADHNVGRMRFSVSDADSERVGLGDGGLPGDVREILAMSVASRSRKQTDRLQKFFVEQTDNPVRSATQALMTAQQQLREFEADLPTTMVMKEGRHRDAFVLTRGEYDRPAEKVARAVPAFLPPLPENASLDRLGLARWIVSRSNPLTARVWVNREWERFFGTGLVKTSENFGTQAEFPSHPALLDWLAVEFMEPTMSSDTKNAATHAWDMKALQKLILMSATYRQTAIVPPEALREDPENRLLSRGPRFRLTAEAIRDQALTHSGLLVRKVGGPSVRPYMPEGVWDETSKYGNLRGYKHDLGEGLYRRTMYTIWKRTAAPPTMLLFDAPSREVCSIKRSRTNTPLQALALLNEVTFVEAAKALAIRIVREGGESSEDRMKWAFRLVTCRVPFPEELHVLTSGLEEDLRSFQSNPNSAQQLLEFGDLPAPGDLDAAMLAAWTVSANVLLNLDEVVTRE